MLLIGLLGLCRGESGSNHRTLLEFHRPDVSVGTLADDCTNVTIANAADAEAVRKSCRVIQGDLVFADTLSESINLDGVETVLGGIRHDGSCGRISGCPYVSPFTISSSTLTRVNQTMYFWYFPGLEKLILPSLVTVDGGFMLKRLHNLTHLDITGLSYVGWVVLETPRLKTLLLDGLKGFTGIEGNGDVGIWDAGEIESVDGFFRNPIDPYPYFTPPGSAVESGLGITGSAIPNVREVNIGWTRISTLTISGKNLTVVLGGPSTKSMEIGKLELMSGVTDLKRSPGLKNLTLTTFFMENNPNMTHLRADFDQVANFTVYAYDSLRALEFPPQAVNWVNLSLHLNHGRSSPLNLSSEHTVDASGQRRKTWYWPERDMREVVIRGNLATDFL